MAERHLDKLTMEKIKSMAFTMNTTYNFSNEDLNDITQECYIRILRQREDAQINLLLALSSAFIDYYRRKNAMKRQLVISERDFNTEVDLDYNGFCDRGTFEDKGTHRLMLNFLSSLDDKRREAIELHFFEDEDVVTICKKLGVTRATISNRIREGLAILNNNFFHAKKIFKDVPVFSIL